MLGLSLRLGVLVHEIEALPMPVIAEYLAILSRDPEPPPPKELSLMDQLEALRKERTGQ